MEFEQYFSEEAIIRELCRARIKLAAKRHDAQFFRNIDLDSERPDQLSPSDWGNVPLNIFPPRRAWHRYRPKSRGMTPPLAVHVETLFRATIALRRSNPKQRWARNLARTVRLIRSRVLSSQPFNFQRPTIIPIRKEPGSNFYRPLAAFPLQDKIVECLTAKYFRVELDHALLPSCVAFRAEQQSGHSPTTHDAITIIDGVRSKYRRLYVAECDIQGFFDCVSHDVARRSLASLMEDAQFTTKASPRALEIFEAYLASYTFERNVLFGEEMQARRKRNPNAKCKWPNAELRGLHGGQLPHGIGVPQGGALSCFIANAVLHQADKALARVAKPSNGAFTYLRYCDDMILLATTRRLCRAAFDAYGAAVSGLRLPIHHPLDVKQYDSQFFSRKSNYPYHWSTQGSCSDVPWIQFVGYQLRRDGLLRVRKKSIDKHVRHLRELTDELIRILDQGAHTGALRRSAQQIRFRFQQKLISISVGRIQRGEQRKGPMPMCWAAGFRMLAGRAFADANIKYLDRFRERQVRRVERRLNLLSLPPANKQTAKDVLAFYGYPFSYCAQFRRRPTPNSDGE